MNNSYLFEKEPMFKHNINLGSTILGRFGAIILLGLAVLSFAGCGGGGDSGSGSGSEMDIRPPGDGPATGSPDLIISSITVSPSRTLSPGERFTLSVTVRNQGNKGAAPARVTYFEDYPRRDWLGSNVGSLGPSETASTSYSQSAPGPGTRYYRACVTAFLVESNTTNNCSADVRVVVSSGSGNGGSNGGGSNGGGSGGGSGQVTTTWACPFGSGSSITVGHTNEIHDAVIRFRGGNCGNFWASPANSRTEPPLGLINWSQNQVTFLNANDSGRTVTRRYTANFCRKSEVSDEYSCLGFGNSFSHSATYTVRWLSE